MAISESVKGGDELVAGMPAGESKSWNWHPEIPIKTSPLFEFPPNPAAIVKWYAGAWLPVTEFGLYLLLAAGVWLWLVPPLTDTKTLGVDWVAALWARNLLMMIGIASLLHLWLYTWNRQGRQTSQNSPWTRLSDWAIATYSKLCIPARIRPFLAPNR